MGFAVPKAGSSWKKTFLSENEATPVTPWGNRHKPTVAGSQVYEKYNELSVVNFQ